MSSVQVVCEYNEQDITPESRTFVYVDPPMNIQIAYREAICKESSYLGLECSSKSSCCKRQEAQLVQPSTSLVNSIVSLYQFHTGHIACVAHMQPIATDCVA